MNLINTRKFTMNVRTDFVSNSSSTSFIITQKNAKEFEECFPKYKKYSISTIKNEFNKLKDFLTSFRENFEKNTEMSEYIQQSLFSDTYYTIHNLIETINEEILDDMSELENNDYITEPIDRDYAYNMGWNSSIYKGDL